MILILNGSPRKHGVTTTLLRVIADEAPAQVGERWLSKAGKLGREIGSW